MMKTIGSVVTEIAILERAPARHETIHEEEGVENVLGIQKYEGGNGIGTDTTVNGLLENSLIEIVNPLALVDKLLLDVDLVRLIAETALVSMQSKRLHLTLLHPKQFTNPRSTYETGRWTPLLYAKVNPEQKRDRKP